MLSTNQVSLPAIAGVWMKHKKAEWYALKLNLFSIIFCWHGVLYHLGINLSHLVKNSIHPSMQAFIFCHRFFCTRLRGCWSISQLGWRQSAPWTGHQFTAAADRETNNSRSHSHSNLSPALGLLICVHVFGVDARAIRENPCWYRYPQKGPRARKLTPAMCQAAVLINAPTCRPCFETLWIFPTNWEIQIDLFYSESRNIWQI